jgi:phage FluMu gp28-like protein
MCNPQDEGGSLLPYGLIAACEADAATLQSHRDASASSYLGIDVGRKHDLTVFWLLRRIGDVLWTDSIRVLEKTPFSSQLDAAAELIRTLRVTRVCIDATGIGAMMAEQLQQRFGAYTVEQVNFTNAVKLDLGMPLLQAFQDRQIRIPTDAVIREDLHKTRKTTTAAGNVRLEADSDDAGHADRFWALALAVHAAKESTSPFAPTVFDSPVGRSVSSRRGGSNGVSG